MYSLPDGLWVYSFSASLYLIWDKSSRGIKAIIIIPFIASLVWEILQYFKKVTGTFDLTDVLVEIVMYIILTLNLKLYNNEKRY